VAVHLSSKLYQKQDDHILYSTRLARQIGEAEQSLGHSRTLIIGDLNMNPFESGVVGAEALHGVADRRIAKKKFGRAALFWHLIFIRRVISVLVRQPPYGA